MINFFKKNPQCEGHLKVGKLIISAKKLDEGRKTKRPNKLKIAQKRKGWRAKKPSRTGPKAIKKMRTKILEG